MNVELDPIQRRKIEALARETGRTEEEVLRELVDRALGDERGEPSGEEDTSVAARRRDAWEKLHAELMELPVSEKGFCGADHDEVLYGWKK